MHDTIKIRGARENNLKNIDVDLPRDALIVFTGLSGSGKSSLAFDTIFADGQRRYMESLSSYARQFLGQMEKPDVDSIEGLSPAISIDQKTTSHNPRSTVGTVTEIYDYLRLLYARVGVPHCPVCGREIRAQSIDEMADKILSLPEGTRLSLLAPVVRGMKGTQATIIENLRKSGYVRARIDGERYDLADEIKLEKNKKHTIEVIVDRLVIKPDIRKRLTDSLETVLSLSDGLALIDIVDGEEMLFSRNFSCPDHGATIEELEPRMFSFNAPYGACPQCTGLGVFRRVDPDLVVPNHDLTIREGAIAAPGWSSMSDPASTATQFYNTISHAYHISLDTPVNEMPIEQLNLFLYGTSTPNLDDPTSGKGVIPSLERRYRNGTTWMRDEVSAFMRDVPCPVCHGNRLRKEVLAVTLPVKSPSKHKKIDGINIMELCDKSVSQIISLLDEINLSETDRAIAAPIIHEIKARLSFLDNVGLNYLTLSRSATTLSGGESQRIRLATQIGASLCGVLYILDEPSIGLHQRDNDRLIATLKALRDIGNTVIVVEHDDDTIRAADYIVDIGPRAGVHGGEVVYAGDVQGLLACKESLTGQYLSGARQIPIPTTRRTGNGLFLTIHGAREHNLKNIDITFPLGTLTCVTGVSGSGKSSLVNEILYKHLSAKLNRARTRAGDFDNMDGIENLDRIVGIDQSPIGRTPRSNPATYTGVFTDIRELYASTNDARARGYTARRFSFNVKGGRCEACSGDGWRCIEMHFLPDVYVPCEVCNGKRYNHETLAVKYRGKSIYDVLEMTVDEGVAFFENHPKIARKLQILQRVGLGYLKIGQSATTLSGGEAQRVKLSTYLAKRPTGRTMYILDEPTTGLATADVHRLIDVLMELVEGGNTVIVIEHNLHVIRVADWIIDLGPEGGDKGGNIVACGTPEQIAQCEKSYTGKYLK